MWRNISLMNDMSYDIWQELRNLNELLYGMYPWIVALLAVIILLLGFILFELKRNRRYQVPP
jgi:hypothetical protein